MRNLLLVTVLVCFGACKDKWDKALSEYEGLKDKMCACKDAACAKGVKDEIDQWRDSMKKNFDKDEKPPAKLNEQGEKIDKEMRECRRKLRDADKGEGAAGAAGGGGAGTPADMLAKLAEYKDKVCACADKACADKVRTDMAGSMSATMPPGMSDDDAKKSRDLSQAAMECAQKLK
jgi:hypothetical protein